ncbi:MAG TPA: hypothetical protein VIV58_38985 [Kofleriaceae bacterium]
MRVLSFAILLGACTIAERDQKGPEVHIEMNQSFVQVSDQFPGESFSLGTDASYSIDIRIDTVPGEEDTKSSFTYSKVEAVNAVFTVPTVTVPTVSYTKDDSLDNVTFMSSSPLVIPASAKGQVMTIHVDGKDGNGLSSNVIDFTANLN